MLMSLCIDFSQQRNDFSKEEARTCVHCQTICSVTYKELLTLRGNNKRIKRKIDSDPYLIDF